MSARPQPIDNIPAAFEKVNRRLRDIEDAMRDRLLPPGYKVSIAAGNIVLTRTADGATSTQVFA